MMADTLKKFGRWLDNLIEALGGEPQLQAIPMSVDALSLAACRYTALTAAALPLGLNRVAI